MSVVPAPMSNTMTWFVGCVVKASAAAAAACGSKMPVSSMPSAGIGRGFVERVLALRDGDAFALSRSWRPSLNEIAAASLKMRSNTCSMPLPGRQTGLV